ISVKYGLIRVGPVPEGGRSAHRGENMRQFIRFCVYGAIVCVAMPAAAQQDKRLSLTIYNSNLALVEHVRPIDVPAGLQRVEFKGVSAQILSQTVSFSGPGLTLIEQNFDYDLLTPAKLMEKAIGRE